MIASIGLFAIFAATAIVQPAVWTPGQNIQRTMRLLATSTREHPNRVKVLFYGQSITKQDWWKTVADDLKRRYPYAGLTCENRAIGGFAANLLKKAVQHDVFPCCPDLIILHDYGGEPDYEELIRLIRSNVASEILVQSDHYVNAPPKAEEWHDQHVGWLVALAERYKLGFVDVRTPWKKYLDDRHLDPNALTVDGTHLNAEGCALMSSLIEGALVFDPKLPLDHSLVHELPLHWSNGRARVKLDGNRVDLNLQHPMANAVDILIDGKKPSNIPELYRITRPTDCYACDVPAVFHIDSNTPLQLEDWTLTVSDIAPDVKTWRFRVNGSKTGDDGDGSSDQPFVSRSGRVMIDPGSWYIQQAFSITGKRPPEGFEVHWQVIPEFRDSIDPGLSGAVTVAQGLTNGPHEMQLTTASARPTIKTFTVYRPPLR